MATSIGDAPSFPPEPRTWAVGALCRAVADALDARFNPVTVRGEISGFSRAASGHCYFTLRDAAGQIRCAMFRRAASLLGSIPRDGDTVVVRGRLGIYEARGDLQMVVESLERDGLGGLWEQFQRIKALLEAEGLFDAARKRPLPRDVRAIGVVTSPQAAAWHDVVTALQRRVPHIPVLLSPASVQGAASPGELVQAIARLVDERVPGARVDLILLVRGGGAAEDLAAFNDPGLARAVAACPVPVVSGVGHETDFTIVDFVADLRAPTPTAAAELVAEARAVRLAAMGEIQERLRRAMQRQLDRNSQRLDLVSGRLGRPSGWLARQQRLLDGCQERLKRSLAVSVQRQRGSLDRLEAGFAPAFARARERQRDRMDRLEDRLRLLDPRQVLERGFALVTDAHGLLVRSVMQVRAGQSIQVALADGDLGAELRSVEVTRP